MTVKETFKSDLINFLDTIKSYVSTENGQWTVKGFIDIFKNIFTISSDTKIVSKILEIHLFPKLLRFAESTGFNIVLADHQNYYPDITFIKKKAEKIKFAVDFKTTYRKPDNPKLCNGFTLGSHGEYFINRTSKKNIQFPYSEYMGHFCFGIIYDRVDGSTINETKSYKLDELKSITSVVKNFEFFIAEKWKIASDKGGSGNTANIGSINNIEDIKSENGMFAKLGEDWFDDYWMNYNKISIMDEKGKTKKIRNLVDFIHYRKGNVSLIVPKRNGRK
ncbi:MAG: EcoRV family type II restriction endonuclease [Spirochaetes bacterium]|nr:EcoRV family type II restriction endonuclease [Spirochaetota bacterium]